MSYLILFTIIYGVLFSRNTFSVVGDTIRRKGNVAAVDEKIVNGRIANQGEFPYQVLFGVVEDGELVQECGGSILNERHVLTAAHCAYEYRKHHKSVRLMVGDIAQHGRHKCRQVKSIEAVYIHEEYNDYNEIIPFDIALLRIKGKFTMNRFVQAVSLPSKRVRSGVCVITGWGATGDDQAVYPEMLQAVNIPLIDTAICRILSTTDQGHRIEPGVVCAGYREGGQDSCDGDSGGPLVCNNVQVGIASWGDDCAEPGKPGFYTDVFYYKDWIENKLEESNEDVLKREQSKRS